LLGIDATENRKKCGPKLKVLKAVTDFRQILRFVSALILCNFKDYFSVISLHTVHTTIFASDITFNDAFISCQHEYIAFLSVSYLRSEPIYL